MSRDIIKLDQIDVTFHQKKRTITAVKDVTIHIQEGDIYGIVGYSGAGKSTLVRVINLLQNHLQVELPLMMMLFLMKRCL